MGKEVEKGRLDATGDCAEIGEHNAKRTVEGNSDVKGFFGSKYELGSGTSGTAPSPVVGWDGQGAGTVMQC